MLEQPANLMDGNPSWLVKLAIPLVPGLPGLACIFFPGWNTYGKRVAPSDFRYMHNDLIGSVLLVIAVMLAAYFMIAKPNIKTED